MRISTVLAAILFIGLICLIIFIPGPDRTAQEVQRKENIRTYLAEKLYYIEKDGRCYAVIVWEGRGSDAVSMTQIDCNKKEPLPKEER